MERINLLVLSTQKKDSKINLRMRSVSGGLVYRTRFSLKLRKCFPITIQKRYLEKHKKNQNTQIQLFIASSPIPSHPLVPFWCIKWSQSGAHGGPNCVHSAVPFWRIRWSHSVAPTGPNPVQKRSHSVAKAVPFCRKSGPNPVQVSEGKLASYISSIDYI